MPRLDSDSDSSVVTSRETPPAGSDGTLAKPANDNPTVVSRDENCSAAQEAMNKAKPLFTQQGDVSSTSEAHTPLDSTSPSQAAPPSTNGSAKVATTSPSPAKIENAAPSAEKLAAEISSLSQLLESVSPLAAGHALQKFWRKFLFSENSEDHLCWVLRAGIKNAPPAVIRRILRDKTMLKVLVPAVSRKEAVVDTVLKNVTYSDLLKLVSDEVLDREISHRLKTMPAKPLIRWLAEAERLGFQEDDILDDEDETVVPNIAIPKSSETQPSAILGLAGRSPPSPRPVVSDPEYISINDDTPDEDVEMAHPPPPAQNPAQTAGYPPNGAQHHNHNARAGVITAPSTGNTSNSVPLMCTICHFVFKHKSCYLYVSSTRFMLMSVANHIFSI
jgi:hypothetical protein